jgi:hypothetical protein
MRCGRCRVKSRVSACVESRVSAPANRSLASLALAGVTGPALAAGGDSNMLWGVAWLGWVIAVIVALFGWRHHRTQAESLRLAARREAELRAAAASAASASLISASPAAPQPVERGLRSGGLPRRDIQDAIDRLQDAGRALQRAHGRPDDARNTDDATPLETLAPRLEGLTHAALGLGEKFTRLHERTDEIAATVKALDKVSERINLLSLNAAIESEKAGERGHGFVAIAQEIRRLADHTAATSLTIARQVGRAREVVSEGVMSVERFQAEVHEGVGAVRDASQHLPAQAAGQDDEWLAALARAQRACDGALHALGTLLQAERGS